ncbi:MAG: hypothetical protein E4H46_05170 [Desulfobacterales bacterium]|nr:MAG: hypothetical protein E4H46_05170 [Desulfobacterales bacterium]
MSLCRIKTVEQLRGHSPGEFGKLLGLDRVPEVRCLRKKLCGQLRADDAAKQWSALLSQHWMQADPTAAGTLYIDGHVRVYHGGQTKLPKKFMSRERLCLRGWCQENFFGYMMHHFAIDCLRNTGQKFKEKFKKAA